MEKLYLPDTHSYLDLWVLSFKLMIVVIPEMEQFYFLHKVLMELKKNADFTEHMGCQIDVLHMQSFYSVKYYNFPSPFTLSIGKLYANWEF